MSTQQTIVPSKTDNPLPITLVESSALQEAFDYLNHVLFGSMLPNVEIGYSRRARSGGHFAPDRFTYRADGKREHELSLNPDGFTGRTDEWIASILLHEMCHLWQHHFGKAKKRKNYAYHDKEWSLEMESLGLMPSNDGQIGGRRTGQKMSHYIIPGGAFQNAFAALAAQGWRLNLQSTIYAGADKKLPSKLKFTCPECSQNAWGKPELAIRCDPCDVRMTAPVDTASDPVSEAAE